MKKHVALLRGINVGGNNKVPMAELRAIAESLGYDEPRTLLQSGNMVFGAANGTTAAHESALERAIDERLGLTIDVMVRSAKEWATIIASNPFAAEAEADPAHTLVMVMKEAPGAIAVRELQESIATGERVELAAGELYLAYPTGIGTSKLTGAVIERRLKARGTARNWNTVLKIAGLLEA